MLVLVDTSIWIDYFRSGDNSGKLDFLIDENLVAINALILTELTPFLRIKNQRKIIRLLQSINRLPLSIDWDQIAEYQYRCLRGRINGVGIPDLIIAQNAKQHHCSIYAFDKHFPLMKNTIGIRLFE